MAWLKANYPIAFYAAMITFDNSKFALYKQEAEHKGIDILGPHINLSQAEAIIVDNYIRTGLGQIKGIGNAAIQIILENQPYDSINDFFERAAKGAVNKKIIETLINNDCLEGLPIIFEDKTLTEENKLFNREPIYLGRGELFCWFEFYYDYKNQKAEKNYLLDKFQLPKYIQEDRQLFFEKDNTIVVPFSKLNEFGIYGTNNDKSFNDEDLKKLIPTRKKAKGKLQKVQENNKITPLLKPFINNEHSIINSKLTNLRMYANDIINNDCVSFRYHPMAGGKITYTKQVPASTVCNIGGVITSITPFDYARKNEQGEIQEIVHLYHVNIVTPYEIITQTFNSQTYKKYEKNFIIGNYIYYSGVKNNKGSVTFYSKNIIHFYSQPQDLIKEKMLYIASIEKNKYTEHTDYLDSLRKDLQLFKQQQKIINDKQCLQEVLNITKTSF